GDPVRPPAARDPAGVQLALRDHARDRVSLDAVRLDPRGWTRQGAVDRGAVGKDARHLLRRRRLRPQDRQAAPGDLQGPRRGVARERAVGTVAVEVVAWVTKFVGGDGSGRKVFEEPIVPGATVRSVLEGLSTRYPELHAAPGEGRALGEHH